MKDMDDINDEFARTDVDDRHRRQRRHQPGGAQRCVVSPIYGMPILNVDKAQVSDRPQAVHEHSGFAGIDNPLFYADNTSMLFGDAKKSVSEVTEELKAL